MWHRLCIYIGEEKVHGGGGHYMYHTLNMVLCPLSGNTDACTLCDYAKSVVVCTYSVNPYYNYVCKMLLSVSK